MKKPEPQPPARQSHLVSAPAINLPKGGGAIRGIGEKFAANPVTGTGSMTVPIATSPGRSGFGPELSLSYDSGAGNGPFGFGWSLSLPCITRKTDKGLPEYRDENDSDVFILSGSEDLVPVLRSDGQKWEDSKTVPDYTIHRYRPRIEGLFARIERWTRRDGDAHWRSISKDNVLTIYGRDAKSRIADPADPKCRKRIFSWLISETRDDKGNAILYTYKEEDGARVDMTRAHERNRGNPEDSGDRRRRTHRYLKRIHYGNRQSVLDESGHRPRILTATDINRADWMFEVVFDYGEHDANTPDEGSEWSLRQDSFSSYRAGFEVRTCRLCQRVLMFHHFEGEKNVGKNCLVHSTDFKYSYEAKVDEVRDPVYSFLLEVTQSGYRREGSGYLKRSLPPVAFEYSQPIVQDAVKVVDPESLENLPIGLDGSLYQWTDLHGEGIPGILTEQGGAWFYKRNLSPRNLNAHGGEAEVEAEFAPTELVASKPNVLIAGGQAQFMDLAGDGQPDLVMLEGPTPGFYEHDDEEGWQLFRPFASGLRRDTRDPNLRFVDLDGDGHPDVLITEDDTLVWHPSLAEQGFAAARHARQALDEEEGPRLVFGDGTQSVYLADLSGDGLTDLVRIRNGQVCYWPNLGHGRFGAKVTMDNSPHFDSPDQFDQKRIRLADVDGTGTTDILYLHGDGVRLYFNQSGNGWSVPRVLRVFPRVDDLATITTVDLLGNGTACLVWSSPLPGDTGRQMRYVELMVARKPHLLVRVTNNLGADTHVHYAPSTKFYLQDKRAGRPWITRLPFPVHVVERVTTHDHISGNRFVTKYGYHHGYFDGEEREFRGFGMVEQTDTEEFTVLTTDGTEAEATNLDAAFYVPPVLTRTWYHTGLYVGRDHISDFFAGKGKAKGEYYREPALRGDRGDAAAVGLLLDDTVLPPDLTIAEEREACRALKGSMLRQEVYALDGSSSDDYPFGQPYTVTEQNFTVRMEQARGNNRHGVFFTHPREVITYHYERNPADPRIQHALTLEVDDYGNVLKQAAIGYGRRKTIRIVDPQGQVHDVENPGLAALDPDDQVKQTTALLTYTENQVTNAIELPDTHRTPLPCEALTFELTGYSPSGPADRFQASDLVEPDPDAAGRLRHRFADEVPYEAAATANSCRRPIEQLRTLYRSDTLNGPLNGLLPLRELESFGLPGESYKLAFTPGLLTTVFQRPLESQPAEPLLPNAGAVLEGQAGDRGGYLRSQTMKGDGRFPATDSDDHWWIPSGRSFFTTNPVDPAATELAQARQHFFLPRRYRDPFDQSTMVDYDPHRLLLTRTVDALDNTVSVSNDYRVLQPELVTDPNRNRTAVAFDALGLVVATSVMGKGVGDLLEDLDGEPIVPDSSLDTLRAFVGDPAGQAATLLGRATTRIVYDLQRYQRTAEATVGTRTCPQPPFAATLSRDTHFHDDPGGERTKIQVAFSYSDGFGREIQKKIQAEPGDARARGPEVTLPSGDMCPGDLLTGDAYATKRWVGTGRTVFNNKGKPVKQYEPFFSSTHLYEPECEMTDAGVSPVLFYDPVERVVATLHPNHTYEKVVFDPWQQTTWDANDTVLGDPRIDGDIGPYTAGYFASLPASPEAPPWETWHAQRIGKPDTDPERAAAAKAAAHSGTPTTAYLDTLGRTFLTQTHNKVTCPGHALDGTEDKYSTRVELDIEGNQRAVRDAIVQNGDSRGRIVMRYDYDMLGNRIHQASMDAGERWMLNDVTGKPIRAWDSRGHLFRTEYDKLRRPVRAFVQGADPHLPNREILFERTVYGEGHPDSNPSGPDVRAALKLGLRGRSFLVLDGAGVVINGGRNPDTGEDEAYDFKGNLLRSTRRLATEYRQAVDWSAVESALDAPIWDPAALESVLVGLLEQESFTNCTTYDALNRPLLATSPDASIYRPTFNEANLLDKVDVNLRGAQANGDLVWTRFVTNIEHNAKGQRTRISYGNEAQTEYTYDDHTFRLIHLTTTRPDRNGLASQIFANPMVVQDLHYTYDPVGNITCIEDAAPKTVSHSNEEAAPFCDYTYDALYRLIEATGREHIGQSGFLFKPPNGNYRDYQLVGAAHPNDLQALRTYTERYHYDAVGNLRFMRHLANGREWARVYEYEADSVIELLKRSNRLTKTTLGNHIETYRHDVHGNMTTMWHLPLMRWNHVDQLQATSQQVVNNGGRPETTYYVYDASGERVRKVTDRALSADEVARGVEATRAKEQIYLGGFEIYRDYNGNSATGEPTVERHSLHVVDDQQRIALVDTRTITGGRARPESTPVHRYQFGNHLGSASVELGQDSALISYEEYHPYGTTAFQANDPSVSLKRYRYTGKERDEESGLSYHGARYYVPWLGRWTSCDPIHARVVSCTGAEHQSGTALRQLPPCSPEELNLYVYVCDGPVNLQDPSGLQHTPPRYPTEKRQEVSGSGELLLRWSADITKNYSGLMPFRGGQAASPVAIGLTYVYEGIGYLPAARVAVLPGALLSGGAKRAREEMIDYQDRLKHEEAERRQATDGSWVVLAGRLTIEERFLLELGKAYRERSESRDLVRRSQDIPKGAQRGWLFAEAEKVFWREDMPRLAKQYGFEADRVYKEPGTGRTGPGGGETRFDVGIRGRRNALLAEFKSSNYSSERVRTQTLHQFERIRAGEPSTRYYRVYITEGVMEKFTPPRADAVIRARGYQRHAGGVIRVR